MGPHDLPVPFPNTLLFPSLAFQCHPLPRCAPYLSSEGPPVFPAFDNLLDKHQNLQTYSGICPLTPNIKYTHIKFFISYIFPQMFSYGNLMSSGVMSKSLIYFELIFVICKIEDVLIFVCCHFTEFIYYF